MLGSTFKALCAKFTWNPNAKSTKTLGLWATTLVTTPRVAVIYAVSFWTLKQVLVLSLVFWSIKSELPTRIAVVLPAKWKKWGAGVLVLLALGFQVN